MGEGCADMAMGQDPQTAECGVSEVDDDGVGRQKRADPETLGREALGYADTLYNLARYLTRNPTDAEGRVQEMYTRAITAARQFTPGTNLKAWLFRILRNTFLSQYRHERYNPKVGGFDTVDPAAQGAIRCRQSAPNNCQEPCSGMLRPSSGSGRS